MSKATFCKTCGVGYVTKHNCNDTQQLHPARPSAQLSPAWEVIAKIFTQELCVEDCEWCVDTPDPYSTGDINFVQGECTVMTPSKCPKFAEYTKEHS